MDIILNNANFRKLWFSSTFAGAASNIIQYALSLYVLDKTGSATAFASILSIIIFPRILFSPIAGVWGDRVDRQKGLVYTTLMTVITLVIFGLGTYVASNLSLVAIYVLVIILELVEVFQSGPMMSVLPAIVEESQLALANTWMQVDNGIVNIITPFVAAFIYSTFSITGSLFISGSILFLTMIGYALMKIPERKVQKQMDDEQSVVNSFWTDFKEGIKIAFDIPNLIIIVLLALFINFLMSPIFGIVITYFIRVTLEFSNTEFSMFQSFVAVVSMISPLIAYRLIKDSKEPVHLLLKYTGGFVVGLFVVMCGTMARDIFSMNQWMSLAGILVGFILVSVLATYINIQLSTLGAKMVPEEYLGRIGTTMGMLATISVPIGQLVFGIILDHFNATVCLIVSIVGLVVFLIVANRMYQDSSQEGKMQFKQEQMEFVNQLLYPILILKKDRDEERPSSPLEEQLEVIVEEMRHISVPLEPYKDNILYFYKDDALRIFFVNVKNVLRYHSFDEYAEVLHSMDESQIKQQLMTNIVKQDEEEVDVEEKVQELLGNQFAFLDFLKNLPIDDTVRWNYFTIMSQPKKFVEDFISLHQTLKPIFEKVYAEYLPILEKSYTEFESTIHEHPTILAEAFTGTKEIEEIDWTSDEISVIPTLLLSDFYFQDSELLILGAKSLEVIQHVIQTRLDKQQERINVFKNLGDKTRYQIFCEIAKGTKSVKKIAEQLGITSATVSYHINELVLSNIVVQGWNKKDCLKAIHTELITEVMNGLMEDSFMTNTLENEE